MTEKKQKIYVDMDGVLVDFESGKNRMTTAEKTKYPKGTEDDTPHLFSRMEPMPGAVKAMKELIKYYDVYILSTAPWKNPTAWDDKRDWVNDNLSDIKNEDGEPYFRKRLILTHHKELLNDGRSWLIDDRDGHGASEFRELHVKFGEEPYQNWERVTEFFLNFKEIL